MIGAVIYYGKNTLVAELPMGPLDLQMKLSSIGVGESADRIPLKDDEERQLQVKLYASSPEEAHLLSLLTPDRSLADANTCADLLWQAEQRALPRLKCGLLADSYRSMDEFVEAAKRSSPTARPRNPSRPGSPKTGTLSWRSSGRTPISGLGPPAPGLWVWSTSPCP